MASRLAGPRRVGSVTGVEHGAFGWSASPLTFVFADRVSLALGRTCEGPNASQMNQRGAL